MTHVGTAAAAGRTGGTPDGSGDGFGWPLGEYLPTVMAGRLADALDAAWQGQVYAAAGRWKGAPPDAASDEKGDEVLLRDLSALALWFDPTATEKRLRDVLEPLPLSGPAPLDAGVLMLAAGPDVALVTPEGRAALWCLRRARAAGAFGSADAFVWLDPADRARAVAVVQDQYREWCQRRLRTVSSLLAGGSGTLRPTAAGMLLTLLVNRNTSPERAVPRPEDLQRRAVISAAITSPSLAFAHALAGRAKARDTGTDLYRGWAIGELARRLGTGLVTDGGIYIRPDAEPVAVDRLAEDLRRRPLSLRQRVPDALDAALAEYERSRPVLNSLGLAHERPSHTAALRRRFLDAAAGPASDDDGKGP